MRPAPRLVTATATAAVLLAGSPGLALAAAPSVTPPGGASFTPGLALKTSTGANTGGAEPSLAVDSKDNVYVTAPVGVPTGGCPVWTIHPATLNAKGLPYEYDGTSDTDHGSVGGGDCDVSTGPSTDTANKAKYDDVSVSSLSLANLTTNNTTDGHTFQTPANTVGQQVPGVDRQWQANDPGLGSNKGVHYLTVHDVTTSNIFVAVSTDGGYIYTTNSEAIDAAHQGTATGNNGNHFGTIVVNPVTHKLYIPFIAPSSATDGVNHVVYVAEGTPNPANAALPITWVDHTVYTGPATETLDHIFPAISIDKAGRVYVAWAGDTKSSATNRISIAHMSTPGDAGAWTTPVFVDGGDNHSNMFPWLAAGKDGFVDVAWYGGKTVGTACNGQSGTAGDSNGVANNCLNQWVTEFAQSTDTGQTFTVSPATGLIHKGSICDQGTACLASGGDRTLLDFFDMEIDSAGGANIAYAADLATPGTAQTTYTRQCGGLSATTGAALTRDCSALVPLAPPGATEACSGTPLANDGAGDAVNPAGGGGTDTSDITKIGLKKAGTAVEVSVSVVNLTPVPPTGTTSVTYYATWKAPNGKQYGVSHTEPSTGAYTFGEFDPARNRLVAGTTTPVTGTTTTGPGGTVTWTVPSSLFGSPAIPVLPGQTPAFGRPYALTILGEGVGGTGLVFTQPSDRAPDAGGAPSWQVCTASGGEPGVPQPTPAVPEAGVAVALPALALVLGLAVVLRRRRGALPV